MANVIVKSVQIDKYDIEELLEEYDCPIVGPDFYANRKEYYEKYPDIEDESPEAEKAFGEMFERDVEISKKLLRDFIQYLAARDLFDTD
jgi:hypothetical protein